MLMFLSYRLDQTNRCHSHSRSLEISVYHMIYRYTRHHNLRLEAWLSTPYPEVYKYKFLSLKRWQLDTFISLKSNMKIKFIMVKEANKKNVEHLCAAMKARKMTYSDFTYKLVLPGMNWYDYRVRCISSCGILSISIHKWTLEIYCVGRSLK